jgi:ubiquinone/menaquinone biosynthesis C-methylase UbiE
MICSLKGAAARTRLLKASGALLPKMKGDLKTVLKSLAPRPIWRSMVYAKNRLLDSVENILGHEGEILPPRHLRFFVGNSGDFKETGEAFFRYFIDLAGLKPEHRVLDVGCGIGRMAIPLTRYLSGQGSYEGFDIVPHAIKWCQDHITSRHSHFRFQLADIKNKEYNPEGRSRASEFRFPHEKHTFDFVCLTSVFTHLLPEEVENYLGEISRVLKPGGTCLITWFLLNPESERLMKSQATTLNFRHSMGVCKTINVAIPEEALAYQEEYVRGLYTKQQLRLTIPIHYGSWCGRSDYLSFQDICVAQKSKEALP